MAVLLNCILHCIGTQDDRIDENGLGGVDVALEGQGQKILDVLDQTHFGRHGGEPCGGGCAVGVFNF